MRCRCTRLIQCSSGLAQAVAGTAGDMAGEPITDGRAIPPMHDSSSTTAFHAALLPRLWRRWPARRPRCALRAAHPDLVTRLLKRDGDATQSKTWMKTYALSKAGGIDAALQADIEAAAMPLQGLIDGDRHVEVFTGVAATPILRPE